MGNKVWCYPLTIADPFSRYVFAIEAFTSTHIAQAKVCFEAVFKEYQMPGGLVNDNGTPFCSSHSLGGLTQLSRWSMSWRSSPSDQPGHPQQNGIHERVHQTLKDWIGVHPQPNLRARQRSFDALPQGLQLRASPSKPGTKTPSTAVMPYRPFSSRPKRSNTTPPWWFGRCTRTATSSGTVQ